MDAQREEMLERWESVKIAIMRAEAGEFLVKYMRESDFIASAGGPEGGEAAAAFQPASDEAYDKVVGIYVDLVLKFPGAIDRDFTLEEIEEFDKGFEQGLKEAEEEQEVK